MADEYERGENCATVNNNIICMDTASESVPLRMSRRCSMTWRSRGVKKGEQDTISRTPHHSLVRNINSKVAKLSLNRNENAEDGGRQSLGILRAKSTHRDNYQRYSDTLPTSKLPFSTTEQPSEQTQSLPRKKIHKSVNVLEPQPLPTSQFFPTFSPPTQEEIYAEDRCNAIDSF